MMFNRPAGDAFPSDRPYSHVANAQYNTWRKRQGLADVDVSRLAKAVSGAAASSIKGATIETQITPTMRWSPKFGGTTEGSGMAAWITRNVIKPKVTLNTIGGPVVVAPYGAPKPGLYFGLLMAAGAVIGLTTAYYTFKGITKR
jgi:hypothetical protein